MMIIIIVIRIVLIIIAIMDIIVIVLVISITIKKKDLIRVSEWNNMINLFVILSFYSNVIILTNQLKFSVNENCV